MLFTPFVLFSVLSVASAIAIPEDTSAPVLEKRESPATLYAANCQGNGPYVSQLEYYGVGHESQNYQQPDSVAIVHTAGFTIWEGVPLGPFQFDNLQAKVWMTISGYATGANVGNPVGNATMVASWLPDGWRRLCCFKDTGRIIHYGAGNSGYSCKSIYWCNPQIGGSC